MKALVFVLWVLTPQSGEWFIAGLFKEKPPLSAEAVCNRKMDLFMKTQPWGMDYGYQCLPRGEVPKGVKNGRI